MAFLSGVFAGHAILLILVKKEAFNVVECMSRLGYITSSGKANTAPDHFDLFSIFDHFGDK